MYPSCVVLSRQLYMLSWVINCSRKPEELLSSSISSRVSTWVLLGSCLGSGQFRRSHPLNKDSLEAWLFDLTSFDLTSFDLTKNDLKKKRLKNWLKLWLNKKWQYFLPWFELYLRKKKKIKWNKRKINDCLMLCPHLFTEVDSLK